MEKKKKKSTNKQQKIATDIKDYFLATQPLTYLYQ